MKFISCHIENFGILHNYDIDLSDGANIICEENGWGKSTFAAFVRAMFYGLDGKGKKSIEANERMRYKPWQGGVFGGSITFEAGGRKYTLNRVFGDKTDELELRDTDTNLISTDYTENIGEELFKIDRESFSRTMFIGQNDCATRQTDDINAKIGNLADNTNDINNYEKAAEKLKNMLNAMSATRSTGSIAKRKSLITETERKISAGGGIADSIDRIQDMLQKEQDKLSDLAVKRRETNEELRKASSMQEVVVKRKQWEDLKHKAEEKEQLLSDSKSAFPMEVPSRDEIKNCITEAGEYDIQKERANHYSLSDKDLEDYDSLLSRFENGTPSEAELGTSLQNATRYRNLKQEQMSEQLSTSEMGRFDMLNGRFADEEGNASSMLGLWNERNTKKATIQSNNIALTTLKSTLEAKKSSNGIITLLIISMTALVLGIILAVTVKPVIGIIVVIAGVVLAGMFGSKDADVVEASPEFENIQKNIDADTEFAEKTEAEVKAYLEKHGKHYDEYSANAMLQEINNEYIEYKNLKIKVEKSSANNRQAELKSIAGVISELLARYNYPTDDNSFSDNLYQLRNDSERYKLIANRKSEYDKASKKAAEIYSRLENILAKYGFTPGGDLGKQLEEIRDRTEIYHRNKLVYDEAKRELVDFESVNDVDAIKNAEITTGLPTLEELHKKEEEISDAQENCLNVIRDYNRQLEQLEEQYNEWEDTKLKLQGLKQEQAEEQQKSTLLAIVKDKLSAAKDAITSKYTKPILDNFNKYYSIVTNDAATKFYLDTNTKVTVEQLGKQREIETQSMGYRDLISICLRIALVDAMYEDEKPVLMLDDPFTNLDDSKLAEAKHLIEEIAKKYQVIYFTCSNSRK